MRVQSIGPSLGRRWKERWFRVIVDLEAPLPPLLIDGNSNRGEEKAKETAGDAIANYEIECTMTMYCLSQLDKGQSCTIPLASLVYDKLTRLCTDHWPSERSLEFYNGKFISNEAFAQLQITQDLASRVIIMEVCIVVLDTRLFD
jgi:hypothetical protein